MVVTILKTSYKFFSAVIWLLFYVHHNFWLMSQPLQVSTTLTQCRINAGPLSILSSVLCWCQCLNREHADTEPCRPTYDTLIQCLAQCCPTVFNTSTTQNQHCIATHVHQEEDMPVEGFQRHWTFNPKVGLMLGKWHKQRPSIKPALRQHGD